MRNPFDWPRGPFARLAGSTAGPPPAATAPSAFTAGQWDATDAATGGTISVSISSLPAANGSAITDIERKVGLGAWTSTGGTGPFSITGLTNGTPVDLQIRAVNAIGAGPASDTKTRTPTLVNTAPTLSGYSATTTVISLTASEGATCYWLLDSNTTRTGAQVEAGGGQASGSFAVSTGTNDGSINLTSVTPGSYWLHVVLKDAGGLYSAVVNEIIEVLSSNVAPTISSVSRSGTTINLTSSEAATAYWLLDASATRTGAQVKAGGGSAAGYYAVTSGANSNSISFGSAPDGTYYLHVVLEDAGGLQSSVVDLSGVVIASPSVVQSVSGADTTFNTSQDVVIPAGVAAGNELIIILVSALDRTMTAASGWSLVGEYAHEGGSGDTFVYRKTAAGTEGGTTATFTSSAATKSGYTVIEAVVPGGNIQMQGDNTGLNPPSLTPTGGSVSRIWLAHVSMYTTGIWNITAAPSGYSGLTTGRTDPGVSGSDGDRTLGTAYKVATSASEDPGTFTISGTPDAVRRSALTIAAW